MATACGSQKLVGVCVPDCSKQSCGSDGCGGTCGTCPPACTDGCTLEDQRCSGSGVSTCTKSELGCAAWSAPVACANNETCSGDAVCAPSCTDACTENATSCSDGAISTCRRGPSGCLIWNGQTECSLETCADASHCATCLNMCTLGQTLCTNGAFSTCHKAASGCLEFGPANACPNSRCADDSQCMTCSDVCTLGATQCVSGATSTCQLGSNGCLGWGPSTACTTGACGSPTACQTCPATDLLVNGHCYDFTTETIATAMTARLNNFVLDPQGGVHVVFYDEGATSENYRHRSASGTWGSIVTLSGGLPGVCFGDVAVDSTGNAFAVFEAPQGSGYGIRYARLDPTFSSAALGWVASSSSTDSLATPRLVFDSNDVMQITYSDGYDHDTLFATGTLGASGYTFTHSAVWTSGESELWSQVAIGPNNLPRVLYTTVRSVGIDGWHQAFLAQGGPAGFTSIPVTLSTEDVTFDELSLTVDAQNNPHVVYQEEISKELRYAVLRNGAWTTTKLASSPYDAFDTSVKVDGQGQPHFAWGDRGIGGMEYAWLEGGAVKKIVPTTLCSETAVHMQLDADGLPHFTCVQVSSYDTLLYVAPHRIW